MDSPSITYARRSDATPEGERNALANVYALVLQKQQARQKATRPGGLDSAKGESQNDSSANSSIP